MPSNASEGTVRQHEDASTAGTSESSSACFGFFEIIYNYVIEQLYHFNESSKAKKQQAAFLILHK